MKITKEFLSEATRLVGDDRETDYGDKVHNHNNIARLWSVYLDEKIEAHDVAIMMVLGVLTLNSKRIFQLPP